VSQEFQFTRSAVDVPIRDAAVAAVEREIEMARVATEFDERALRGSQPALEEVRTMHEEGIGDPDESIVPRQLRSMLSACGRSSDAIEHQSLEPGARHP